MFQTLKAYFIRKRFERLFSTEIARIKANQLHHLQVKPSQADLQERVHDALRRGLSA